MVEARTEFWGGGDFRSTNIGAAAGDHFLGRFEGPGVYLLVGKNAKGKTSHLDLLQVAQDEALLRQHANITRGRTSAHFQLGPLKIAFRTDSEGELQVPERTGENELPRVESLPLPIQTLIHADHLQGEPERMRRRLAALLSYAPVLATAEIVDLLCRTTDDRSFSESEAIDPDWWRLAQTSKGTTKARITRHQTADELRGWLLARDRESVITDHRALLEQLNLLGSTGEKAAQVQAETVAGLVGRLEALLDRSWWERSGTRDAHLKKLLESYNEADLEQAVRIADTNRNLRRQELTLREAEIERREAIRKAQGAAPDPGPAKNDVDAEVGRQREREEHLEEIEAELRQLEAIESEASGKAMEARARLRAAVDASWVEHKVIDALVQPGIDDRDISLNVPAIEDAITAASAALQVIKEMAQEAQEQRTDHLKAARAVADSKTEMRECAKAQSAADKLVTTATRVLAEVGDRLYRWKNAETLLDSPLGDPIDEAMVGVAETAFSEASRALQICRSAGDYQEIFVQHAAAVELRNRIESDAADYRRAAKESWGFLGEALTDALDIPWLSLAGQEMFLRYDTQTGFLVRDKESPFEARSIDDSVAVSSEELHTAMLQLMLERRTNLGGILLVPWEVVAALDEDRLANFDKMVQEAGLVVLSERPRRREDPEDLFLERVSNRRTA